MSKRKMCEYFIDMPCDKRGHSRFTCPKNTNSKCEIVKPKARYKTIKGWADIAEDGEVNANSLHGKVRTYPCEIRIKTKYLGGK